MQQEQSQACINLKAREAARRLGISVYTLYKLALRKVVPCVRIGKRRIRFREEDIERLRKEGFLY